MSLRIGKTSDYSANSINMLVYGYAGSGKTTLATTCDSPIILAAEPGVVSIRRYDYTVADGIESETDLRKFIEGVKRSGDKYKTVFVDSLTRVAKIVLDQHMGVKTQNGNQANGKMAYGNMGRFVMEFVQMLRDIPQDTVWICQQSSRTDEATGGIKYGPGFPGQMLMDSVHYEADIVARLCNQTQRDGVKRWLQLQGDDMHEGKNWFGGTNPEEPADIGALFRKIRAHESN